MPLTVHWFIVVEESVCGKNKIFPYFQCQQPNPTSLEHTNLLFKLKWDWALRGVGSAKKGLTAEQSMSIISFLC